MERLVVISNRTGDLENKTQTGGLAVGIVDALRSRGGMWVGWNGEVGRESKASRKTYDNVISLTMPLSEEEHEQYYLGFANKVLWPAFHYRLDLMDHRTEFVDRYAAVNRKFADMTCPHLREDDLIWIHDYHLIPLAAEFRQRDCRQKIGFFLHIPFPSADVFSAIPYHDWLRECFLQFDLIGLQTKNDVQNFCRYLREHSDVEFITSNTVRWHDQVITIADFPIGIDVQQFAEMAHQDDDTIELERMRRTVLKRFQIISADRLDYSKGLPQRMKAFRKFLEDCPEYQGRAEYLQIASPSREDVSAYADIRAELEGLTGAVNGKFADFNWAPIQYINRNIPREQLAQLFRCSLVGLITPLRDGMNLVAKEYVAAQDDKDPGILILSKFAGAAEELDQAIIVNPYDIHDVAQALKRAAVMSMDERRERHRSLLKQVTGNDANQWKDNYLAALQSAGTSGELKKRFAIHRAG
ncbi:alpha,alpha-trehalose-phosphate synthase (UDP-forming) [Phyllobacterium myrsinacearum]|uniref:Trehalose 6-phosphate synthase n=1 Tax=Phyllobacterium myrsinacearum TaxID=28101 RepID=A0A839EI32_9HYPH|nr:trehalose-6-phosphate synthase [Phyllobacterium myrsinacearum]MBA8879651.1 trehalose 6-phosphate synthase [Phyllobacterium myrsinacearum]